MHQVISKALKEKEVLRIIGAQRVAGQISPLVRRRHSHVLRLSATDPWAEQKCINLFFVFFATSIERLERPGESQLALDEKKVEPTFARAVTLCEKRKPKYASCVLKFTPS